MFQTLSDLLVAEPWWEKDGNILGHAYSFPFELSELQNLEICWCGVAAALKRLWINDQRTEFSENARKLLLQEIEHCKSADEQSHLEVMIKK
jgi:hypothetical protein